jgi:glycosyltransferase involved in cell wall biosynthesis
MKLLWFSHMIPYPPRGGVKQRSFNLLGQACRKHKVTLIAFNFEAEPHTKVAEYKRELEKLCNSVEIWDTPYARRSVHWWAQLGWNTFLRDPFISRRFWSQKLAVRWQQVLHETPHDLIHFDAPDLSQFFNEARGFRKVLNHHNCESAMAARRAEQESNPIKRLYLRSHSLKLERLERRICPHAEVNLVVSKVDGLLLQANNVGTHIHVVENGTDTGFFFPQFDAEEPGTLVFAGSLDWYPNVSGLRYFAAKVWPQVKHERPEVRIYLAGRNPAQYLVQWAREDSSVVIVANPKDIRPWIAKGSVFVCPILDGGGTRLKILDAMAMGKPVVTTSIGCEGLQVTPGEDILVADHPADLAQAVLQALREEGLRKKLSTAARRLAVEQFDWGKIGLQLERSYLCALGERACEREIRFAPSVER